MQRKIVPVNMSKMEMMEIMVGLYLRKHTRERVIRSSDRNDACRIRALASGVPMVANVIFWALSSSWRRMKTAVMLSLILILSLK